MWRVAGTNAIAPDEAARQGWRRGLSEVSGVGYRLPDGRRLPHDLSFRVGDGIKTALIGANGCGKTTLLRLIAEDLPLATGTVARDGNVGVMRQFIGTSRGVVTVRDLLLSVAPQRVRSAAAVLDRAEIAMMNDDEEANQLAYAAALTDWADASGYEARRCGISAALRVWASRLVADLVDRTLRPGGLLRRTGGHPRRERNWKVALPPSPERLALHRLRPTQGGWKLGSRVVPGHFPQTHEHPELTGRSLQTILWEDCAIQVDAAVPALRRYELIPARKQTFDTLSGGQQARFQILLLELSGATMLLLDEPTDNLDVESAEALEAASEAFDGTVLAVTHDRGLTRAFGRFIHLSADGRVSETPKPVWAE